MKKTIPIPTDDMTIKVTLSVLDRLHFNSIMPRSGNTDSIALGLAIKKRVAFTPEERVAFKITPLPNGMISFDSKAPAREYRFEEYELLHVQRGARYLEDNELVEEYNFELVKKILAISVRSKSV